MKKSNRTHFIGIGGIGMSGLARLYLHEGAQVSGSDIVESENTRNLTQEGAHITYSQDGTTIYDSADDLDLVVYTEAVSKDNPELIAAQEAGIRTVSYFEALGEVANDYYLIAVSGTHGKTTTTAMLIDILEEASFDPTAIVGALRTKTGSNFRAGKSKYFVVEACEYKRDFLTLQPDMLVITNIEHEHVDYYRDLADVQAAFRQLARKVPEQGTLIYDSGDTAVAPVLTDAVCRRVDYRRFFDPLLSLPQPGLYNQLNAAAATAAAHTLGVEEAHIKRALEHFSGAKRRFEYKGELHGAKVYDDYAHHPTEIEATIAAAREKYPSRRLMVLFQPHTYSRTKALRDDFAHALQKADSVILLPIYAAREPVDPCISSKKLAEDIGATYVHTLDEAVAVLRDTAGEHDVLIVMGAGDVTEVADRLTS